MAVGGELPVVVVTVTGGTLITRFPLLSRATAYMTYVPAAPGVQFQPNGNLAGDSPGTRKTEGNQLELTAPLPLELLEPELLLLNVTSMDASSTDAVVTAKLTELIAVKR